MAEERPAFTLEGEPQRVAEMPLAAWALACAGLGLTAGAALLWIAGLSGTLQPPCAGLCGRGALYAWTALAFSAPLAAAALAAIPVGRQSKQGIRIASTLAVAASASGLLLFLFQAPFPWSSVLLWLLALAAPCAMLTALRPDTALTPRKKDRHGPLRWLGVGAIPSAALFAGFGAGVVFRELASVGAALLAVAGALLFVQSKFPEASARAPDEEKVSRLRALARMTPMQRHAAGAELSFAFALAACLTALIALRIEEPEVVSIGAALALGGLTGALFWRAWAPRADGRMGRGSVLTVAYGAGALAPFCLFFALPSPSPIALFGAAGAAAFALASAPQRHALLYDLASSRMRARTALDVHALKLAAAALGVLAFTGVEYVAPGLGLPLASGVGLGAVAVFAPTLGGLGRRAR